MSSFRELNRRRDLRPIGSLIVGVAVLATALGIWITSGRARPGLMAFGIGCTVASVVLLAVFRRRRPPVPPDSRNP